MCGGLHAAGGPPLRVPLQTSVPQVSGLGYQQRSRRRETHCILPSRPWVSTQGERHMTAHWFTPTSNPVTLISHKCAL